MIVVGLILAMPIFAACTMGWFRIRCRWWEVAALAFACLLLVPANLFMDYLAAEYVHLPASKAYDVARDLPAGGRLVMVIGGRRSRATTSARRSPCGWALPATTGANGSRKRGSRSRASATR